MNNPFIVDLEAAPSGSMLDKKAPVGAFFGSTGGSSSQKKRSGDKKKAALAKPHSKESQYSKMESDSGDSVVGDILASGGGGSLLGSAATTLKAKRVKNNLDCSFPLGFLDYNMDNDDGGPLPFLLDPKIIKTQVEIAVKKSFALDINISNVEGKSVMAKTQLIRKIFSKINGFGRATIPSKFEEIIRSTFTSEKSMKKAASLAGENRIIVNTDLKRQGVRSDQAVVIKKIPMDMPKEMIITTVSEYGQIVSIKVQLIGLWQKAVVEFAESSQADLLASKWLFLIGKDSVHVAKAVGDCETWAFKNQFRTLLFTLPVGMTAHDLGTLLKGAGGKTCVINHSLETGNRTRCAVVCFESDKAIESAFRTESIFGSVKLSWTRLDLVRCKWCGKFGHFALECDAEVALASQSSKLFKKSANLNTCLQLTKLYAKKKIPISRPVAFGGKSWAQVASVASVSHSSCDGSGSGFLPFGALSSGSTPPPLSVVDSPLGTHLACLECSVKLLSDQILNILLHLDNLSLVLLAPPSSVIPFVSTSHPSISGSLMVTDSDLGSNMVLDVPLIQPISFSSGNDNFQLGLSSFKVLTSKIGILESKLIALNASIGLILFVGIRVFTSGLNSGHMDFGIAIIMNNFLARHVLDDINSLIARTVNEFFFIILGGNFNEDGSHKSASFRKCFDLGLVNSLSGSLSGKEATWANSRGVAKIIDYVFVSSSLVNAILDCNVSGVEKYFDTDHKAVSVSVGLGGLLDVQLNLLCKQANKDHWKYNFVDAGDAE
ncbi:hypothetical protein G9A89_001932 [Geosiphon pyriformis]|nr:hypothetical protein G9A89_001932 [Geosiphon pyriformis]